MKRALLSLAAILALAGLLLPAGGQGIGVRLHNNAGPVAADPLNTQTPAPYCGQNCPPELDFLNSIVFQQEAQVALDPLNPRDIVPKAYVDQRASQTAPVSTPGLALLGQSAGSPSPEPVTGFALSVYTITIPANIPFSTTASYNLTITPAQPSYVLPLLDKLSIAGQPDAAITVLPSSLVFQYSSPKLYTNGSSMGAILAPTTSYGDSILAFETGPSDEGNGSMFKGTISGTYTGSPKTYPGTFHTNLTNYIASGTTPQPVTIPIPLTNVSPAGMTLAPTPTPAFLSGNVHFYYTPNVSYGGGLKSACQYGPSSPDSRPSGQWYNSPLTSVSFTNCYISTQQSTPATHLLIVFQILTQAHPFTSLSFSFSGPYAQYAGAPQLALFRVWTLPDSQASAQGVQVYDTQQSGAPPKGPAFAQMGQATLSSGAATVTLPYAYSSATSYVVVCTDTTAANACKTSNTSSTQFTITGTGTDVIRWLAWGY